jgi:hypothetical protein
MPDTTLVFDAPAIDIEENNTPRKQNSLMHMLSTLWFWTFFTVVLVTALFTRLYQAGKDAYTDDWSFGRSAAALPEMFGGFGSLLGCLLFVGALVGGYAGFYWLSKINQNALAALLSIVCIAIAGFIGWAWIDIDVMTALGFVVTLIVIFAAVSIAGMAVVYSQYYTVPDRKVKPVSDTTNNDDIA